MESSFSLPKTSKGFLDTSWSRLNQIHATRVAFISLSDEDLDEPSFVTSPRFHAFPAHLNSPVIVNVE